MIVSHDGAGTGRETGLPGSVSTVLLVCELAAECRYADALLPVTRMKICSRLDPGGRQIGARCELGDRAVGDFRRGP